MAENKSHLETMKFFEILNSEIKSTNYLTFKLAFVDLYSELTRVKINIGSLKNIFNNMLI